jgi:hypothetical protein
MATSKPKSTTDEDLELLAELGVDITPEAPSQQSPRDERIIAGFEEIDRFVAEKGRLPEHGDDRDIFERLYAVRLERLRESAECRREILSSAQVIYGTRSTINSEFPLVREAHDRKNNDILDRICDRRFVQNVPRGTRNG